MGFCKVTTCFEAEVHRRLNIKMHSKQGETKHPILSGIHIHVESLSKIPQSVCMHNDLRIAEWIFMHRIIRK